MNALCILSIIFPLIESESVQDFGAYELSSYIRVLLGFDWVQALCFDPAGIENRTCRPPTQNCEEASAPPPRASKSPSPTRSAGGKGPAKKGKSKPGKGKGASSSSMAPVTQQSLLADVVRTLVAHEDELLALKFNHSFLMYARVNEQSPGIHKALTPTLT